MQDYEEFERDEELLEKRRLKRLEMKRKRKIQQRVISIALVAVLVLIVVLIARGCSGKPEEEPEQEINTPEPAPEVEPEYDPDVIATIAAVGDIMMYDSQIAAAKQEDMTYDFTSCFEAIYPYTASADLTFGNLELNFLGSEPYMGNTNSTPYFNAPENLAANLSAIGFDILQTANTYSIMNGMDGLKSTINILNQNSIDHVGTHATDPAESASGGVVIRDVNGIRIAVIGFTKGVNNMALPNNSKYAVDLLYTDYNSNYSQVDTTSILERIDAAKSTEPDIIIAMLHWGEEYKFDVKETQEEIRDLMFKNGVDVILGSHSHVVGPMETVEVETTDGETKECFVAYSLGNFISSMDRDNTKESVILNLEFTKSGKTGDTTITDISYTPLYILDRGEGAERRFEVLPIRKSIASSMFEEHADVMNAAIENLKTNTASEFDSGN